MAIVAECPRCGKRFKADEKLAGKKAKCSQCAHVFAIGVGSGDAAHAAAAPQGGSHAASAAAKASPHQAAPAPAVKPLEAPPLPSAFPLPQDLPHERTADITLNVDRAPAARPSDSPPPARGKSKLPLVAALAAVIVLGGAAAVWGPRLVSKLQANAKATAASKSDPREAVNPAVRTIAHVQGGVPAGLQLPTPPAWTATPDKPAAALSLPDGFRLPIAAEPGLRFNATGTVLAPPPSPFAAVMAAPETDRSAAPYVEIWNLATKTRSGQFKLARPLTFASLSPDGAYFAGHAHDEAAKATTLEIWSAATGQLVHSVSIPGTTPPTRSSVLGFPAADQVIVLNSAKLELHDLKTKAVAREFVCPVRPDDLCVAASAGLKLIALADAKTLTLIDFAASKRLGAVTLPEVLVAHPRRPLSPRAIEFSPDGKSIALLFDNRLSARRIGVVDVATGRVTEFHSPAAPVYTGGPELQWLPDGSAFLVGSGVLIDRASDRQVGQIYVDLADEGLGGALVSVIGGIGPTPRSSAFDRALIAWDKQSAGLVLRAVNVRRESPEWVNVSIASASTALYDQLQCVSRQFGNAFGFQSMSQIGRLADQDASKFLVVNVEFTATLAESAPDLLPLRPDQFALIADGQARPPIGTLAADGSFTLERPEYDLRKRDRAPRRRAIVFAVSGNERSLALRIGNKEKALGVPAAVSQPPTPALSHIAAERLPESAVTAPDDVSQIRARVIQARVGPYTVEPDAAEHLPLSLTYEPPRETALLTVHFELTATAPRTYSRVNRSGTPPKVGLLLSDGTHVRPVIELPGLLPIMLSTGERRTHTCLFLLRSAPQQCRLTYENSPVATVKPEPATAAR
jgi:hypothetical protein